MANAPNVSTDFLMNGTAVDLAAERITDKALINQFNRITELCPKKIRLLFLNSLRLFCFRRR
jgi:hypothetical protein